MLQHTNRDLKVVVAAKDSLQLAKKALPSLPNTSPQQESRGDMNAPRLTSLLFTSYNLQSQQPQHQLQQQQQQQQSQQPNTNQNSVQSFQQQNNFFAYQKEDSTKFPIFPLTQMDDMFANSRSKPHQLSYDKLAQQNSLQAPPLYAQESHIKNDNIAFPFDEEQHALCDFFHQDGNAKQTAENKVISAPPQTSFKGNLLKPPRSEVQRNNTEITKSEGSAQEEDRNGRCSRGLRGLSLRVKDLVLKLKTTSYKQVADLLVDEMRSESFKENQDELIKDEQNIKRRVYDALNVLIATKVLAKKGKTVIPGENSAKVGKTISLKLHHITLNKLGKCLQKDSWGMLKKEQTDLEERRKIFEKKRVIIIDYINKTLAINYLVQRNKRKMKVYDSQRSVDQFLDQNNHNNTTNTNNNNNDGGTQQSQTYLRSASQQAHRNSQLLCGAPDTQQQQQEMQFNFPLIQMSFSPLEQGIIVKMSQDKKILKLYSKQYLRLFGDLDVLIKLGLHQKVALEMRERLIPKEILEKIYQNSKEAEETYQRSKEY